MDQEIRVTGSGERLDHFLARHFPDYSRGYFQDLIARGCVQVNGVARPSDYRLHGDEGISVRRPAGLWIKEPFENWVIFEDASLIALNKPSGLLMHPMGGSWLKAPEAALSESEASLAGLLYHHRPKIKKAGVSRCGLVHRLDRETSGILVIAKTVQAQERLIAAFAGRRVEKIYRALVLGSIKGQVDVEAPVGRPSGRRRIQVTPFGRQSVTEFHIVEAGPGVTLVEARPQTGRTHQIRAHLAHIRHPVLGDPEWGKESLARFKRLNLPQPPRMMLHAYRLTLAHPRTGKPVRFTAPLPRDFKEYWRQLST